ncbi:MAG: hypothetical protein ACD_23C01034G0005, partial [uncultured bacterium]
MYQRPFRLSLSRPFNQLSAISSNFTGPDQEERRKTEARSVGRVAGCGGFWRSALVTGG